MAFKTPVRENFYAGAVDNHRMCRTQFQDIFKNADPLSARRRNCEKFLQADLVDGGIKGRMTEKSFYFGRKQDCVAENCVEKRLYAEAVAAGKKPLTHRIPDTKRIYSVQKLGAFFAVVNICI